MKHQLNHYFKSILLIVVISFFTSCEREDILNQETITKTAKFQVVPNSVLIKSNAIVNALKNFSSTSQETTNKSGVIILSEIYNFAIDTEFTLVGTAGNYKTYTFKVLRENPLENTLENLVIHVDTISNDIKQFLMQYPIINNEYDLENIGIKEIYDTSLT